MFDAHCAVPPPMLIQLAAAIKPYDVLFIEEPAVPGNIEVFKRLKQQIDIPLATGERDARSGRSCRTCRKALPTSCSPTAHTPAASRRCGRSPRWPRPITCRWRRTA